MGVCAPDGSSCVCHDEVHYWASERCQQYHDGPDPNAPSGGGTCPALLSVPSENSETSGGNNSSSIGGTWQYGLIGLLSALVVVAVVSYGGYKYYTEYYLHSGQDKGSPFTVYSAYSKASSSIRAETSFNNATFKHSLAGGGDMELSIMEENNVDENAEVDLSDMAGIYSATPVTSTDLMTRPSSPPRPSFQKSLSRTLSTSLSFRSFNSTKKKPIFDANEEDFTFASHKMEDEIVLNDNVESEVHL
jgi:hypothetical protein